MATVAFGSIKSQIETTAPPRGLWCDFPLGRPLGVPSDPEFQHRVLAKAFELLDSPEPIFAEYDVSIIDDENEVMACPMPPRHDPDLHPAIDEAKGLRPAYERSVAQYGNRVGAGRVVQADEITDAIDAFVKIAEGTPWKEAGVPGIPARVSQDIRGYYETAALALSDHAPPAWAGTRWFLDHTEAGRVLMNARQAMADAGEPNPIWFYMAPGDR
ncbi:MAG: hypothetical protein VX823_02850 [Actinomycetota bacterium]|jgi:hypothetical protein|nr:hypothetical protein [Acidimicrobiaceae bacterium]MEC7873399.1 hypothetical protein [Actinomycetota bacterium]